MDVEKLISCIQAKKPLWDQQSKDYHNRIIVRNLWEEVAKEMVESSAVVKLKRRNLRDNFRREVAKLNSSRSGDAGGSLKKPKWVYFEMMSFLKDTFTARPSTGNVRVCDESEGKSYESDEESEDNSHKDPEPTEKNDKANDNFRSPATEKIINEQKNKFQNKRKRKEDVYEKLLNIEQKKLETYSVKSALSDDSDYHFLMSLHPLMKALSPVNNMRMRLNIQQLFLNEEINRQSGFHSHQNISTVPTPQVSPYETSSTSSEISRTTPFSTQYSQLAAATVNAYDETTEAAPTTSTIEYTELSPNLFNAASSFNATENKTRRFC